MHTLFSISDKEADKLLTNDVIQKAWIFCVQGQKHEEYSEAFHIALRSIVADLADDKIKNFGLASSITEELSTLVAKLEELRKTIKPPINANGKREPDKLLQGSRSALNQIPKNSIESYVAASKNLAHEIRTTTSSYKHSAAKEKKGGRPKTVGLAGATCKLLLFWIEWAGANTVPLNTEIIIKDNGEKELVHPAWSFAELILPLVRSRKYKPSQVRSAIRNAAQRLNYTSLSCDN